VNHFHFPSANALPTISFYERYFGFRKIRLLGNTHILINQNKFLLAIDESTASDPLPATSHLGFQLPDKEEVRKIHEQMRTDFPSDTGHLLEPSARALHYYCSDPSGNRLEIGWYELS